MVSAEGGFPKSGNDPIYAGEVNNFMGKAFGALSQVVYNSAYDGWSGSLFNTGSPNFNNMMYDVFNEDSMVTTNMAYPSKTSKGGKYIGPAGIVSGNFTAIDDFDDGSLDTDIWDDDYVNGTVTEGTGSIMFSSTGANKTIYLFTSGTAGFTDDFSNYLNIKIHKVEIDHASDNNKVRIRLGSSLVWEKAFVSGDTIGSFPVELEIIRAGSHVWANNKSVPGGSWTYAGDIGGNRRIKIEQWTQTGNVATCKTFWDYVRYYPFTSTPDCVLTQSGATLMTEPELNTVGSIANALSSINAFQAPSKISISSNSGTNYYDTSGTRMVGLPNAGSELKTKITWESLGSPTYCSEYSTMYNIY